jgi:DNA repair photolyase
LFANPSINILGSRLILLTKSINTHYLEEIPPRQRKNIVVTFSLNPESIADLWEGKYPDTGERITPSISQRLVAARHAMELGFEIRIRVDPILTPEYWEETYRSFYAEIKAMGVNFAYWTLGTYREKNNQLDAWRERWGLTAMEWLPGESELTRDGTHLHIPEQQRMEIYGKTRRFIQLEFPNAKVSLCKETHRLRKMMALCNDDCNCLI